MRRSPRLRVASNLNGGYEKRVCRPERATVRREISDESHTEVARNERNRLHPMKNAGYIGKLVETRSLERQRVAAGLISVDQPRDKFMCRPRYIRHVHREQHEGCVPKKARRYSGSYGCSVLSRFHLCTLHPPFLPRATARRQYP